MPRRCHGRLLFNFLRASRCHRNRLYRSSHPKVAAHGKVHKISGHTRGRNVMSPGSEQQGPPKMPRRPPKKPRSSSVQLFESFPAPPESPPSELASKSCGSRKSTKNIRTHTRTKCNLSWFGVTGTPEDAPKTPEDAPVIFCQYGLVGPVRGPRQRFLRPETFVLAPAPRGLINSPLVLKIPQSEKHKCGET